MVLRQGDEPERQLGEVDRLGVAVHAVEAALRDLAAGEDDLVLVRRNLGHGVVRLPGRDQRIAELAAGFDQECAGAHGGVADLEVENLLGTERPAAFGTQAVEDRRERGAHDRLGELARRVVRARPAPLLARLQHHRALGHEVRGRVPVDDRVEGGVERLHGAGIARRPPQPVRQLPVGALL